MAIAAEDYRQAAAVQREIDAALGEASAPPASWDSLGIEGWLAERVEQLGYRVPTDIQRRSAPAILVGSDAIIRSQTGSGKTLAFLVPLLSILDYPPLKFPDDLKGPQAVIVVPHRELGVQIVMLIYRLFGGSVNSGIPGASGNMFGYTGPRGIKVRGCLDKEEVIRAKSARYLKDVHVVVGTPDCLAECGLPPEGFPVMEHTKIVVVDEADLCLEHHRDSMREILTKACAQEGRLFGRKPALVLVGATMDTSFCEEALTERWLRDPIDIGAENSGAIPASVKHRFVVVPEGMSAVSMLSKLLRADTKERGVDAAMPRVIAFVNSAEEAEAVANPLRNSLWEEHRIGLLLPDGEHPVLTMQEFRDNKTSMLLATPTSARGLDLPAVSHVYNLGLPSSSTEYLHRAGRTGRTGMDGPGLMTTIVAQQDVPKLLEMAKELNIANTGTDLATVQRAATNSGNSEPNDEVDTAKKELEDLFNLY